MWETFDRVVRARRSVRRFTKQPIAEQDMRDILEAGVLAPNSSNLQAFELVWVRSSEPKAALVDACLSQSAARKAAELVVCVARWDRWDDTRREYLEFLRTQDHVPRQVMAYYEWLSPTFYSLGPANVLGRAKGLASRITGLARPIPRGPYDREDLRVWSVKSAALVCENIMLAASAKGFDSCAMEGIDPLRVGRLVGLKSRQWKRTWDIPMVLAFGYRDPRGGVWGQQWRRARDELIKEL